MEFAEKKTHAMSLEQYRVAIDNCKVSESSQTQVHDGQGEPN